MTGRWDCYAHAGAHRNVMAHELLAEMDRCGIGHAMLVPFLNAPGVDDLLDAAHTWPERFRAMCRVDVAVQDVAPEEIAALLNRGFCGARVMLPDAQMPVKAMGIVLQMLDRQGKVLLVHAPEGIGAHATQLATWVERYPRLRVFVPHLGWPRVAQSESTPDWAQGVRALAECEHVFFGLSALYFYSQQPPPFEDTFPLVQVALQALGPARCVLAGDYPMTLERCTYAQAWESLAQAVNDPAALDQMWNETPARLWGER